VQYGRIESSLPRQRGNVSLTNLAVLNAILYVAEQGCKWRGLPKRFGNWHTIYTRMNRWSKNGVLDRIFEQLQREQIVRIKITAVKLDSTIVKVHPDGTGALKKRSPGHRQVPRRMDHQDSSGCRECSNGDKFRALARPSLRREAWPHPAGRHWTAARAPASHHGSRLRRQRNPATGAGFRLHSRGSSQKQSIGTVAIR
jgi:transposase